MVERRSLVTRAGVGARFGVILSLSIAGLALASNARARRPTEIPSRRPRPS